MLRAFAIMCVVIDNGNRHAYQYGIHNTLFTQEWVVQVLWMICGISWSLSKSNLGVYILRLLAYVLLGGGLNCIAWMVKGSDWQSDLAGVLYQMWFAVALIMYVSLTVCIKPALRQAPLTGLFNDANGDGENSLSLKNEFLDAEERSSLKGLGGFLVAWYLVMAALWGSGLALDSSQMQTSIGDFLGNSSLPWTQGLEGKAILGQLWSTLGLLVLIHAGAATLRSRRTAPWLCWIVIAYVYVNRILILPALFDLYGGGAGRFFVGFEFFLIGLVASTMGLKHKGYFKFCLDNYWIVLLGGNAMLWGPTWNTRMDRHAPADFVVILRIHASELMFVVLFLAAGSWVFPERAWPPLLRMWISRLGLVWFLVHKALHIVAPEPLNWILLFVVLPLAFLAPAHLQARRKKPDASDLEPVFGESSMRGVELQNMSLAEEASIDGLVTSGAVSG